MSSINGNAERDDENLLSRDGQPPSTGVVSTAYGTLNRMSASARIALAFALLIFVMMFTNMISHDYTAETKWALLRSGASQRQIDTIIPPTQTELQLAAINRAQMLDQLAINMTLVMDELKTLRSEVNGLKASGQKSSASKPPTDLRSIAL